MDETHNCGQTCDMTPFQYAFTVRFEEADPAGIGFFAHSLRYHHQAYETWVVQALNHSYTDWFLSSEFAIPVRKSETDYNGPLHPGARYIQNLTLKEVGDSSFVLESSTTPADKPDVALTITRTVHVFMDVKTRKKMLIPDAIRAELTKNLST